MGDDCGGVNQVEVKILYYSLCKPRTVSSKSLCTSLDFLSNLEYPTP
jgi:hypothetical protein